MAYAFNDNKTKFQIPDGGSGNWVDAVYPVGSVYLSASSSSVNPGQLFGGTWEQVPSNYYLMSATADTSNPNAGSTGGIEKFTYTPQGAVAGHKLTVNEMPSHTHSFYDNGKSYNTTLGPQNQTPPTREYMTSLIDGVRTTGAQGGSQSHNHGWNGVPAEIPMLPKYLAVKVWVRTA